jgi:hypothetical protein
MISLVRVSSFKNCCGLLIRMAFRIVIDTLDRISLGRLPLVFSRSPPVHWVMWGLDFDPAYHEFKLCAKCLVDP